MTDTPRSSIGARRNPDTETAVLDAAAEIIAEEGFAKLTMEAVARRARAGKATLYRWWPSRGHLLLALYTRAKLTLPESDTGSLHGDLTACLGMMVRQWRGDDGREPLGPLFRLLIAEAQLDDTVRQALHEVRHRRWLHIDNIFARARARGELGPDISLERAEQRVISMMWFLLMNDELPEPEDMPELVRQISASFSGPVA